MGGFSFECIGHVKEPSEKVQSGGIVEDLMRSTARFPIGALLLLCAFHAVADGVRPLAMPVRLVTVWTSEQLAEETLPFVAKDASRSIIDPASMLVRPLVETIRRPLPIWTNLPPPSA